jgi:predicted RNase H-like HicB family nuclease
VIKREGDGYVSSCPELDVASQGDSVAEARRNLIEAIELFFETADRSEIDRRLPPDVRVEPVEVRVG